MGSAAAIAAWKWGGIASGFLWCLAAMFFVGAFLAAAESWKGKPAAPKEQESRPRYTGPDRRATTSLPPQPEPPAPVRMPVMDRAQAMALLGLREPFSAAELRSAYAERVKKNHPDRVAGMSPEIVAVAEAQTQRLNAAFELLSKR